MVPTPAVILDTVIQNQEVREKILEYVFRIGSQGGGRMEQIATKKENSLH
jgi:hypothetical protein